MSLEITRRQALIGAAASAAIIGLPFDVKSQNPKATVRRRRMRRAHGVQKLVAHWLADPGFTALVDRVGERAVLARFFQGMYQTEASERILDQLQQLVAQRGWPTAINRMTRLGGAKSRRQLAGICVVGAGGPCNLSERHSNTTLLRLAQVQRLYRSVANRDPSAKEVVHAFNGIIDYSPPTIEQSKPAVSWKLERATAFAQDFSDGGELSFELTAIVVSDQVGGTTFVDTTYGTGSISATGINVDGSVSSVHVVGNGLQSWQISQILNGYWYALFGNTATAHLTNPTMERIINDELAQRAASNQVQLAEADYQSRLSTFLDSPEMAFFGGAEIGDFTDQLMRQGLQEAQVLATLSALGAGLSLAMTGRDMIAPSVGALMREAANAWRTGQLALAFTAAGGGLAIYAVGGWLVLFGIASLVILVPAMMNIAFQAPTVDITNLEPIVNIMPVQPQDAVMDVGIDEVPSNTQPEAVIEPEVPDIEVGAQGNVGEIAGPESGPTPTPGPPGEGASQEDWTAWYMSQPNPYGGFSFN